MLKPHNLLLITIDTLRRDYLGCYGHAKGISPFIDELARKSIRFDQAITGGSWTQAAFPVMLTSTYASMYGGCLGVLSPRRPSPVEVLSRNGYATAAVTTSPLLSKTYGYDHGFSAFFDLEPGETDPWLRQIKGGQWLLRQPLVHRLGRAARRRTRPARLYANGAAVNETALRWLSQARRPFFLWLHYMDVHWPYHIEEELVDPGATASAWRDLSQLFKLWRDCPRMSEDFRTRLIALYERAVSYVDEQIGALLKALTDLGLMDETVIVLTADHGEEFGEHGRWGHPEVNLFDEVIRVPLIIRQPKGEARCQISRQVRLLDLMPTVLELCEIEPPPGMEGTSLVPLWSGRAGEYQVSYAISERGRDEGYMLAVRSEQFKLIWDSGQPEQPQLYDLRADPGETSDVAHEAPETVRELWTVVNGLLQRKSAAQHLVLETEPELNDALRSRLHALGYIE